MDFNFIFKKRGISTIIAMVMLLVFVFVIIGVVWGVVMEVVKSRTDDSLDQQTCVNIHLEVIKVSENCDDSEGCNVTVRRRAGGGNMTGIKVVFGDGFSYSSPLDDEINLNPLETYKIEANALSVVLETPTEIEVTPYVIGIDGSEVLCDKFIHLIK